MREISLQIKISANSRVAYGSKNDPRKSFRAIFSHQLVLLHPELLVNRSFILVTYRRCRALSPRGVCLNLLNLSLIVIIVEVSTQGSVFLRTRCVILAINLPISKEISPLEVGIWEQ